MSSLAHEISFPLPSTLHTHMAGLCIFYTLFLFHETSGNQACRSGLTCECVCPTECEFCIPCVCFCVHNCLCMCALAVCICVWRTQASEEKRTFLLLLLLLTPLFGLDEGPVSYCPHCCISALSLALGFRKEV